MSTSPAQFEFLPHKGVLPSPVLETMTNTLVGSSAAPLHANVPMADSDLENTAGHDRSRPIDAQLIRRAQQGDAAAFEEIYRLCNRRVYALCFRMVGNPLDAEELTQEAFMQVFRKIQTFRGESAFTTWLHRLTFNAVLMRFRKKQPATTSLEEMADPDQDSGAAPRDIGTPDLRLTGTIDRLALQRAIHQLAPGYKAIFILHDVEGYGHDEISQILHCSIGNSKSQLHKARGKLRRLILTGAKAKAAKKSGRSRRKGPRLAAIAARMVTRAASVVSGATAGKSSAPHLATPQSV